VAKGLAAALLCLTLAGCSLNAPVHLDGLIAYWCQVNEPERPTRAQYATYTEKQKRDMNAKNTYGAKHCGWKP
jgi:hypothetical protein